MPAPSLFLRVLTYLGFVSLGLPDTLTGVVWPSVARHFALPIGAMGAVLVASLAGYLASSVSAGAAMRRLGVGGLLSASGALVTVSLAGFGLAPAFGWFLAAAVVAGLGAGAIDAGLNAYAARHFSARQMSWLHGCWGVGATLGTMATASVLAAGLPWETTYGLLALALAGLSLTFFYHRRAWQDGENLSVQSGPPGTLREALGHPLGWAQMMAFFTYSGLEMSAGNWAFTLLSEHRAVPVGLAGAAVSGYWGALTLGRFLLGAIADHVGVHRLLAFSAAAMAVGGLTFAFAPATGLALAGLTLLGFALAPVYPGLMTLTPKRLGRLAEQSFGCQVGAAMAGAVSVPAMGGVLLDHLGFGGLTGLLGLLAVILGLMVGTLGGRGEPSGPG